MRKFAVLYCPLNTCINTLIHVRATITLSQSNHNNSQRIAEQIDEIKMYLDARYVSVSEGIWRIFHYRMHGRAPKVQRLAVHLPEQQYITFRDGEDLENVIDRVNLRKTTLTAFFKKIWIMLNH